MSQTSVRFTQAKLKLPPPRERVQHVIRIEVWNWDFMFGIDDTKFREGPYYDYRHLHLRGAILRPTDIKAREAEVTCFADTQLPGKSNEPIRPVGFLSHSGKDYSANLHMPYDVLPLILLMLTASKYRFVAFEAAKSFRGEAPIFNFRFSESEDESSS